jgi:hypothetical protein
MLCPRRNILPADPAGHADHPGVKKLHAIAAGLAALLCALALSVGAALASDHGAPTKKGAPGAPSSKGFYCPLHDLV